MGPQFSCKNQKLKQNESLGPQISLKDRKMKPGPQFSKENISLDLNFGLWDRKMKLLSQNSIEMKPKALNYQPPGPHPSQARVHFTGG